MVFQCFSGVLSTFWCELGINARITIIHVYFIVLFLVRRLSTRPSNLVPAHELLALIVYDKTLIKRPYSYVHLLRENVESTKITCTGSLIEKNAFQNGSCLCGWFNSLPTGSFCMPFCPLLIVFKIKAFSKKKIFQEHQQSVKQFGPRSGPTKRRA